MRLFPYTWEGLHPAYPENPNPSESCLRVGPPVSTGTLFDLISSKDYGILAFACVAASAKRTMSLQTRRGVGFFMKTSVFITALGVANGITSELAHRRAVPLFLGSGHIEPPKFEFADRLSYWDSNNWSILGGVAGVLVARRNQCPLPRVSKPEWFAVHAISGIWVACFGYWLQRIANVGSQADLHSLTVETRASALQEHPTCRRPY